MIYLKKAVAAVRNNLFSKNILFQIQKTIFFQLVVISSLKNYLYRSIKEEEIFVIPDLVRRKADSQMRILVLDMDETLVYTRRDSKPIHQNYKLAEYGGSTMHIEVRPLLQQFLSAVSSIFQVYVYTAGNKQYADAVLNQIDQKRVIKKRFYRESCKKQNGIFYKDLKYLKKINKINAEMILIDDNEVSVGFNYPFSLKIKQFMGDQSDRQLVNIFEKLLRLYN